MEMVDKEHQLHLGKRGSRSSSSSSSDPATTHMQLHRRVMDHELLQQVQVHVAGPHVALHHMDGDARQLVATMPSKVLIGVHFPDIPGSELTRLNVPENDFHPAAAAAADWDSTLAKIVAADGRSKEHLSMCRPELLAKGQWELDVAVCPQVGVL